MNNLRFKSARYFLALMFGALTFAVFGEGPYFFQGASSDSITAASLWKDAQGQSLPDISSDADYVIPADVSARFTTASFAGHSLTVGDSTGAGTLLGKYYSGFSTFNNLVLAKGSLNPLNGNQPDNRARIDGHITVTSPASAPFVITPSSNNKGIGFALKADIAGAAGTGLELKGCGRYADTITLSGDNAGYLGDLVVKSYVVSPGYVDWQLFVDSPTAFGGALTDPKADAVTLEVASSATLTLTANAGPKIAAANRGMTITGNNSGGLALEVESGADIELALPIAGTGSVRKTGAGRLTLSGDFTASGTISCEEGALVLASSTVLAKVGAVGGDVSVRVPTSGLTAAGIVFDAARLTFVKEGSQLGTLVMDGACTLNGKTTLAFESVADLSDVLTDGVLLAKIPAAVKTVTADDFDVEYPAARCGLPRIQVVVSDLGDNLQGISVRRLFPVVKRADGDPNAGSATFATAKDGSNVPIWDNELAVQSGSDYLLTADRSIRSTSSFVGESLTLEGGSTLIMKALSQDINPLFAYPGAKINNGNPLSGGSCELTGHLAVYGTWDNPVSVNDHGSTAGTVLSASLEGNGVLALKRNMGNSLHFTLQGESSAFKGSIIAGTTYPLTLTVMTSAALGGALDAFNYRSLVLGDKVTLIPSMTMTLETANRGILVSGSGIFEVTNGVELVVKEPITFAGTLWKTGSGTLALGSRTWFENAEGTGVTDTPTADKNILVVSEGAIKPASADAFDALRVEFAEGTTLALDLNPSDAAVADKGLVNVANVENPITIAGDTLTVRFDGDAATVGQFGVATLATRALAEELAGKVSYARIKGRTAGTSVRDNDDGTATVVATLSGKGLILLFR